MEIIAALFIGFLSGVVGAISTGAALISIPSLIFLGINPISAIATTRLSSISGGVFSTYKYHKNGAVLWKYVPYLLVVAVIAGVIGPRLLLEIDETTAQRLIGVVLLVTLPFMLWKKDFGALNKIKGRGHKVFGLLMLFLVIIYGTMFAAGGGTFLIYALIYFFGMTAIEGVATGTVMWIIGAAVALVSYTVSGVVIFSIGIPLLIGAAIGGYLGAHIALKKGIAWVKWVMAVVIVASSLILIVG